MRPFENLIGAVAEIGEDRDAVFAPAGKPYVITGTDEGDFLYEPNSYPAKFLGLGGDDIIEGGPGADTMIGGDGNDSLYGAGGDDLLNGGAGDDLLRGNSGDDTLNGGAGFDAASISALGSHTPIDVDLSQFVAGQTTTLQVGDTGTDTLISIERINITTTAGDDTVIGSSGVNGISNTGGSDSIDAGAGDDIISSLGSGHSTLMGGAGDDQFLIYGNEYNDYRFAGAHDLIDLGPGFDTAVVDWSAAAGDVTLTWGKKAVRLTLSDGQASETFHGLEALTFWGGFDGGATMRGGAAGDNLGGGYSGSNVIDGRGGDDGISGGSVADSLTGGAGDDAIYGGGGNDTLAGGKGYDRYTVMYGQYDSAQGGYLFDESGFDTAGGTHQISDFEGGTDSISGFEAVAVYTHGLGADTVIGSGGDDFIQDSLGTDLYRGGAGDDLMLQTSDYIDPYNGPDYNDTFDGGAGVDTLSFADAFLTGNGWTFDLAEGTVTAFLTGTDSISGFEHVIGSSADDTMLGSVAGETLDGGGGDDRIEGRRGADVLTGGDGADAFIYERLADSSGRAADLITDLGDGDVIDLSAIDADATAKGNQAFHIVAGFTHHAGELVLSYDAARHLTHMAADVNGDGDADLMVDITGDHHQFEGIIL